MNTIHLSLRNRHGPRRRWLTAILAAALLITLAAQLHAETEAAGINSKAQHTRAPLSQFRLPTFNSEGHRSMLIESSEAIVEAAKIELSNLNLTLFDGTAANRIETILLSPQATAYPEAEIIDGQGPVRIIRDDVEISGTGWRYEHAQQKVSIAQNTRIQFHAALPDLLR